MNKFKCLNCGGSDLSYDSWVKCRMEVLIQYDTGFITFFDQQIDDTNVLPVECRFICRTCKKPVLFHYGHDIQTESELIDYLTLSVDERAEMQAEFEKKEEEIAQSEEQRIREEEKQLTYIEEHNHIDK